MDGGRNTFLLLVTAIVINCAVIKNCCLSGRRHEYTCVACYCNFNALRCDIDLLSFWTAAGISLCCLLMQL